MTKKEAIRLHREMWNWIADYIESHKYRVLNIQVLKSMWCRENGYPQLEMHCFCCAYVSEHDLSCINECPIRWENHGCNDSEYGLLLRTHDPEKKAELARKIANLPERI